MENDQPPQREDSKEQEVAIIPATERINTLREEEKQGFLNKSTKRNNTFREDLVARNPPTTRSQLSSNPPTSRSRKEINTEILSKYKEQQAAKSKMKNRFLLAILLNLFSLFLNGVTIFIYAIEVEYIEYDQSLPKSFIYADLIINCYFIFEIYFTSYLMKTPIKVNKIFLLEVFTILSSILTFVTGSSLSFGFIRVFKILTIFKTLKMIKSYRLKFSENSGMDATDNYSHDNVREELVKMIALLMTSLFLSAGLLYFYNVVTDRDFIEAKFSFIDSFYFIIGTGIKLGYGDIVPESPGSKMLTVVILIFWIYTLSNRITKIILLLSVNKLEKKYPNFVNHFIILGNLHYQPFINFLEELLANDVLFAGENKPQVLVITNNSKLIEKVENYEVFRGIVYFLYSEKFGVDDLVKSSIVTADKVFCLNQDTLSDAAKSDRILNVYLQNITAVDKSNKPKEFYLQFQKLFDDTWLENKAYRSLNLLETKNGILVNNMFNPGFFPFINNLFSHYETEIYSQVTKSDLLEIYLEGLKMKICYAKFPSKLMDIELREIALALYKIDKGETPKNTVEDEAYKRLPGSEVEDLTNAPILIGCFYKDVFDDISDVDYSLTGKSVKTGMYGIFIHNSQGQTESHLNRIIKEDCVETKHSEFCEFKENELNSFFDRETDLMERVITKVIRRNSSKRIISEEEVGIELFNHIVILGHTSYLENLVRQIRIYNFYSPIVLVDEFELFEQREHRRQLVNKFSNLIVIEDDYLKLDVLKKAKVGEAKHVLILNTRTDSKKFLNHDFKCIMASRIVEEHFDTPFTVEMNSEFNTRLLGRLPISDDNTKFETEFYPNYFSGKIVYTSLANKMLARSNKDNIEFELLKQLIQTSRVNPKTEDLDFDMFKQRLQMFSLPIPATLAGSSYGELVVEMLSGVDPTIPLGLMVSGKEKNMRSFRFSSKKESKTFNTNIKEKKISNYFDFLNRSVETKNIDYVIVEHYSEEVFLTHPPKNFVLGRNMKVLCLGEFSKSFDLSKKIFKITQAEAKNNLNDKINLLRHKKKQQLCFSKLKGCLHHLREHISLIHKPN